MREKNTKEGRNLLKLTHFENEFTNFQQDISLSTFLIYKEFQC